MFKESSTDQGRLNTYMFPGATNGSR